MRLHQDSTFGLAESWRPGLFPIDCRDHARQPAADGVVYVETDGVRYAHPVATAFCIIAECQKTGSRNSSAAADASISRSVSALLNHQLDDGSFRYPVPVRRYGLVPGWSSAMAQGLVVAALREAEPYLGASDRARARAAGAAAADHLALPLDNGGCTFVGRHVLFFEECPTKPAPHILNGACFAIMGLAASWREADRALARKAALDMRAVIAEWDLGYWSRYDLQDRTPASPEYHALHIVLMNALDRMYPEMSFGTVARRFAAQAESRLGRGRALFSLVVRRLVDIARGLR